MARGLDYEHVNCPLWSFEGAAKPAHIDKLSAVIAVGKHLFPFRTEKLSPPAPMVLGGQPPGRVGRRRITFRLGVPDSEPFFVPYDRAMELRDDELLLRPPTDADVPAVVAACQDEELSRFIPGFPKPYREYDARGWIASRNPRDKASKTFLIVNASSDELLGAIEVR